MISYAEEVVQLTSTVNTYSSISDCSVLRDIITELRINVTVSIT